MENDIEKPVDVEATPDDPVEIDWQAVRFTRTVHVVLGLVVAAGGAWMLYRSLTELPFMGDNGEPGPGYLPVLLTVCLIALGLALSVVSLVGPRARSGEAPTLSFGRAEVGRALLVWVALGVCTALIEPFGFLIAGEVLVLVIILIVERMRSIPSIVALLLIPPAMYFLFDTLLEVQLPEGFLWTR
jgi:hypothetical protein